jgi:hypothetical protein
MPSPEPLTNRVGPGRVETGRNRVPANVDTLRALGWCCIACVRSGRRGEFRVIVLEKDGRRRSIARSASFRVGRSGRIAARGAASAAHDALVSELIAAGAVWTPRGHGTTPGSSVRGSTRSRPGRPADDPLPAGREECALLRGGGRMASTGPRCSGVGSRRWLGGRACRPSGSSALVGEAAHR